MYAAWLTHYIYSLNDVMTFSYQCKLLIAAWCSLTLAVSYVQIFHAAPLLWDAVFCVYKTATHL